MTAERFRHIYQELIEENPLAIRAVLKVLKLRFTDTVPTLAVTCAQRPILLVNLDFVRGHCRTDSHVKAVICHEFLHVLLRHTDRATPVTRAEHLACDAVINAIIHRTFGPDYSGMMAEYYAEEHGMARLLRAPTTTEWQQIRRSNGRKPTPEQQLLQVWAGLYHGVLVADDIRDLARGRLRHQPQIRRLLLGGHEGNSDAAVQADDGSEATRILGEALDASLKAMSGASVFREQGGCGVGTIAYRSRIRAAEDGVQKWCRETLAVLRRHVLPDRRSPARGIDATTAVLPVLTPRDRRAALRAQWSPFLPDSRWDTTHRVRAGTTQVYLDVSGSMSSEMPMIIALLWRLVSHIRRPFWAFSNIVTPARIEKGQLVTGTTGGTSLGAVLEHVARTKPRAAVVVTDGYVEPIRPEQVAATAGTRLHVIVTRDGNPTHIQRAGLPCTQLSRIPS